MRYIHEIYSAPLGERWDNETLRLYYEERVAELRVDAAERERLRDFVRFQLVGERGRRTCVEELSALTYFAPRAAAYEAGAERALDLLAERVRPAAETAGVEFDALLTTTSTGNLMPGLSYRMARRLGGLMRADSLLIDLGNVGCTGSLKAVNLARSLGPEYRNILVVAVELPTTLIDTASTATDVWQANCTFGDGCVALWISGDPEQGSGALALEEVRYRQRAEAGLHLIRWRYGNYYGFALGDEKNFDRDVRTFVVEALSEAEAGWKEEPRWAIHPAGIALLVRISRKLGIPGEAIQPSVAHYRENSNMSSASLFQILADVAAETPAGSAVNLLTMGAGFNVIYGRARRVR